MGYLNPLFNLPAGQALLNLPAAQRAPIEAVMRDLRKQADAEAERSWRKRKGPMAAYWRAVSTYARHVAHALSQPRRAAVEEASRQAEESLRQILIECRESPNNGMLKLETIERIAREALGEPGPDVYEYPGFASESQAERSQMGIGL